MINSVSLKTNHGPMKIWRETREIFMSYGELEKSRERLISMFDLSRARHIGYTVCSSDIR
jgi:hypothetical protein